MAWAKGAGAFGGVRGGATFRRQSASDNDDKLNLFEVTYTWKQTIPAETEEDAIAIARNVRTSYGNVKGITSEYTAKRAEFIAAPDKVK